MPGFLSIKSYHQGISQGCRYLRVQLTEDLSTSKLSHVAVDKPEILAWLLTAGINSLPCGSLYSSKHCSWLMSETASQERAREAPGKPQTIKNVIAEVTYHSFCHILFIKSELISPAQTQELGITQGHEHQEVGILGSYLRGFLQHK